jgi:hypothetical protein
MYLDGKGSTSPLECLLTPSSGFDGDFTSSVAVVSQLGVQVYNGSTAMFCDETNVFGLTPIYIGSLNLILNERKLKIEDTTSFGKFTKERSDSEELSYIIKHIVEGDQLVPYIIVSKYGSEEIIEKFKLGIIP